MTRESGRRVPVLRTVAVAAGLLVVVGVIVLVAWQLVTRIPPLEAQPPVQRLTVHSEALGRDMEVAWMVAGPEGARPADVLYLLHGRYGDEDAWFAGKSGDGVGIGEVARRLALEGRIRPVALVSVAYDDSYGVDSPPADDGYAHGAYGTYLATEVMPAVEAVLPLAPGPVRRYAAGYSMGAFAALHLVLRDPEAFAGVAALSPAVFLEPPDDRRWLYGDPAHDPLLLLRTAPLGAVRAVVGYGDGEGTATEAVGQVIADGFADQGAAVDVETVAGGHDMRTWRALAPLLLTDLLGDALD